MRRDRQTAARDDRVERLFREFAPAIRARARRTDPSIADDVASDVFAIALRRYATIPTDAERAWLLVVTDNVVRNHVRSGRRAAAVPFALAPHAPAAAPAPSIPVVGQALGALPERERALLTMTALEGLSAAEAADRLGISPGTALNTMVRARRHLSLRLAALGTVVATLAFGFLLAEGAQAYAHPGPPSAQRGPRSIATLRASGESTGNDSTLHDSRVLFTTFSSQSARSRAASAAADTSAAAAA